MKPLEIEVATKQLWDFIDKKFPKNGNPEANAMNYVMANHVGSLSRPLLVYQIAHAYGASVDIIPHAVAVEVLHRATLILDDMPSMDNSGLRHGRASCWNWASKEYEVPGNEIESQKRGVSLAEMVAVLLSGTYAPELVANSNASEAQKAYITERLREASKQLVRGQCDDLGMKKRKLTLREHGKMYEGKTGSLLAASAQIGGRLGNASEEDLRRLGIFGRAFGVAYQLIDDNMDLKANSEKIGKPVGQDQINGRPNLASRLTHRQLKRKIDRLRGRSLEELERCSADLSDLSRMVEEKIHFP